MRRSIGSLLAPRARAAQRAQRCAAGGRAVLEGLYRGRVESLAAFPFPSLRGAAAQPESAAAQARSFERLGAEAVGEAVGRYYHCCVEDALRLRGGHTELLAALERGDKQAAYCLAEAGAGSDASAVAATANLQDGQYILNGEKLWVTNAATADVFLVFATTETDGGRRRLSAFIVEKSAAGLEVSGGAPPPGLSCSIGTVVLKDCAVPQESLVGAEATAHALSLEVNSGAQFRVSAALLGLQKEVMRKTVAHARSKKAFGRTLHELPLVKQRLARMAMATYASESLLYMTAAPSDAAQGAAAAEAALAKVFIGEACRNVADEAVGVVGAAGCGAGGLLSDAAAQAQQLRFVGGTAEINTLLGGLTGCEAAAKDLKARSTLQVVTGRWKRSLGQHPRSAGAHPSLQQTSAALDKLVSKFGAAAEQVMIKLGKKVTDQQMIVMRMSRAAALLHSMVAVVSRASRAAEQQGEDARHESVLAQTYCQEAAREVEAVLLTIDVSKTNDINVARIADHVCVSGGYSVPHPCDL